MKKLLLIAFLSLHSAMAVAAESNGAGSNTMATENESQGRNFLFRAEPHWLLLKEFAIDFQFKITDHLTLGPTLGLMREGEGVFYGTQVSNHVFLKDRTNRETYGVRAAYYFRGFERSSAILAGFGKYASNHVTTSSGTSTFGIDTRQGNFSETIIGVTGGYQWVVSRFVFNATGGLASYNHPGTYTMTDSKGFSKQETLGSSGIGYAIDGGVGVQF
ncbi:MAG: hypothetical protein ACXVA9_07205 [Bdellovibrionales bacterium]